MCSMIELNIVRRVSTHYSLRFTMCKSVCLYCNGIVAVKAVPECLHPLNFNSQLESFRLLTPTVNTSACDKERLIMVTGQQT